MTDAEVKVVIGALLHDIGKIVYRQGNDKRNHSKSGHDFLKEEVKLEDEEILNAVLYHHADMLKRASLDEQAIAYIVYIADNIASAADRRKNDSENVGFEISTPLQSVFNILNLNKQNYYYAPKMMSEQDGINFPSEKKQKFDEHFYHKVKNTIADNLKSLDWTDEYINSLLAVMEATLSYVPSSTAVSEMADISLYDHVKLTAAVASCLYGYLQDKGIADYQTCLYKKAEEFYKEEAFLLFSMDISGIQDFIYTITTKKALRTLRTRSFYLEIMMEHMIDGLLEKMHLSRANLLYSGGGHCYMLFPNTSKTEKIIQNYIQSLNAWLLEQFQISLYVAYGYASCSTNMLKNMPEGSYAQVFQTIGEMISEQKMHRYSAHELRKLNTQKHPDYTRECKVCKKIGRLNEENVCKLCASIENFSKHILFDDFFSVSLQEKEGSLPLPGGFYLEGTNAKNLTKKMEKDDYFVRAYSKNNLFTGKQMATKLWVGDYTTGKNTDELAEEADGIDRIAVLRADVDNLGHAFVSGFANPANQNRYVTLSRTATLSRQLSLFFKYHINQILENPTYSLDGKETVKPRNATICYSGGDDLFIIGSWDEVIELAMDIQENFKTYTQGTLTLSAGIGLYKSGYPISAAAGEVASLEDASKGNPGKNAVTVFPDGCYHVVQDSNGLKKEIGDGTYTWEEWKKEVVGEKYKCIKTFFDQTEDRGNSFLYHLLELIRMRKEKINFARYVYLLARLEPDKQASPEQKENYKVFSQNMYRWIKNEKDCRQLKSAIILYVYKKRREEDESNGIE